MQIKSNTLKTYWFTQYIYLFYITILKWKIKNVIIDEHKFLYGSISETVRINVFILLGLKELFNWYETWYQNFLSYFISVYRSGHKRQKYKNMRTRFSRPLIKIDDWFFLRTFLLYMSIYSIVILYVSLSVRLQRAEM